MDERGKIVNATFLVSAASTIAAHMGFTFGTDPDFVVPLLVAKLAGGIAAVCAALFSRRTLLNCLRACIETQ